MAKKGQQVQLQAELTTEEEWEKFLSKDGLLLIDIYSDWCGPCSGMAANLKKIKLEFGGDLLLLAIAKNDHIKQLERFRGRSEPTWLFVSKGKKVNMLFGCNAPLLKRVILEEIKKEEQAASGEKQRDRYSEITDLEEIEIQRQAAIDAVIQAAKEKEEAKRIKEYEERKIAECNNILENLPNIGTMLIFPCGRDKYHDVLNELMKEASLITTQTEKIKMTRELIDEIFFFCEEKLSLKTIEDTLSGKITIAMIVTRNGDLPGEIDDIVLQLVYGNSRKMPGDEHSPCQQLTFKKNNDDDVDSITGIWAPPDKLTRSLVLKYLFPNITAPYKFPDVEPTPFYIAVAYDAFKTKEVMELSDLYPGQVMMYGFFDDDKPETATLILKTVTEFEERTTPTTYFSEEKIIIQLAKTNPECLLAFTELGPTYMSADAEKGEIDCKYFFPDGYNVPKEVIHEVKKKFKKKKNKAAAVNQEENTSVATSDLVKEQEELEHEDEEGNSEEEKIECDILPEEHYEQELVEDGNLSARSIREADKATSPIADSCL
ncbi:uncharacterized protein LOC130451559 isoform X1 [Diorhabda sublineata]|uniref:uncharacterized protein LOC130451559 isoform X1 n=1 Tax=Diorhabda sublineata TaxID=1163346 RepID=UPI0024E178A4|nr:uncharacterized protein LOC130451559 isoform X1 [Diorhabda sublineata]